ncbi:MAG: hypothetical protein HY283_07245 [Nitrospirae bacterium]|nr:hypothetical protein [Nitrospirota bacterium]
MILGILTVQFLPALYSSVITWSTGQAWAQPIPPGTVPIVENIKITKHNLSSSGLGTTHSSTETEICVFCHTPHGSSPTGSTIKAPIWNRNLNYQSTTAYVMYDNTWSFSFEGTLNDTTPKPTGYSRLCLSCHDGTIAIGSVINKPGSGGFAGFTPTVANQLGIGPMATQPGAQGSGVLTGDTRVLGTNLQNDHPISFKFDTTLATVTDTELVDPGSPPAQLNAVTPLAPAGAYKTGVKRYGSTATPDVYENVQCTSCHNPHAVTYPKFLRAARFQDASESGFLPGGGGAATPTTGQIICLYCHSKPGWNNSTHDLSTAEHAAYPDSTNPYDFDGSHTVGAYACRNCHDPHTAQGAKRLHKEGVTAFGGADAIENTCFLCHSPNTAPNTILPIQPDNVGSGGLVSSSNPRFVNISGVRIAPDIYSEFHKDSSNCLGGGGASPGSAMCLQLATGHEPVFISRSQEGVQLKSEGVPLTPILNEESPGNSQLDVTHVECVDCHNPHQVNSPNSAALSYNGALNSNPPNANGEGGRLKGMKGIGIDSTGSRPVVVGRCEPGFVICGTDVTINGQSANRDPYVYEVCFRCHGNSYTNLFGPSSNHQYRFPDDVSVLAVPPNYSSYIAIPFSPRSDPTNGLTGDEFSMKGFSNNWRELNPQTADVETPPMLSVDLIRFGQAIPSHTQQSKNAAYHPVVMPGRNRSFQLCNQLTKAFDLNCGGGNSNYVPAPGNPASALIALNNLTIQCTDCHNNNAYDVYGDTYSAGAMAGDTSGLRGPLTESNLRPTDIWPALNNDVNYITGRPSQPIGPHGSTHIRLLRANYNTDILNSSRCFEQANPVVGCAKGDGYSAGAPSHSIAGGGGGIDPAHFKKFLLCFQCHDRRAFDPSAGSSIDGSASLDQDKSWTRFFGLKTSVSGVDSWWNGNLHMYHLRWSGAMCHECHYNIHSNVEALNTIYGDGHGGLLPPDGTDDGSGNADGVIGTHLINFGPTVEGTTNTKPNWWYDGSAFRCYLRCHNEVMDSCAYQATSTGTPNARWCAGGRNPGTSG